VIGVGTAHWFEPLPPPNRAGGFPAHGSPVSGFTSKRVDILLSRVSSTAKPANHPSLLMALNKVANMQEHHLLWSPSSHVCPATSNLRRPYSHTVTSVGLLPRDCTPASTFLHPFAPPALPGFDAPMDALTPSRQVLRILMRDNERPSVSAKVSLLNVLDLPTIPSSTTLCHFLIAALARYFSRMNRRVYPSGRPISVEGIAVARSEVRLWLAGSPTGLAESGSSSYGLVVHLPLLSTPPRGDAVTVNYRFVTKNLTGTRTPPIKHFQRRTSPDYS
jgi:hypothetical protein